MKKTIFKGIMGIVAGAVLSLAFVLQASAMTPTLSLTTDSYGNMQTTVYGDANAPVILDYYSGGQLMGAGIIGYTNYSGYFSSSLNANNYSIPNGSQVVVVVDGQQSAAMAWTNNNYYNNSGYNQYSNVNGYVTPILSQSSVALTVGQSQTVTINSNYNYNYNNYSNTQYYVTNTSNNIVTATISGNTITLYGQSAGSASLTICSNPSNSYGLNNYTNSNGCTTLYVTVTGNNYYYPPTNNYYPPTNYYPTTPYYPSNYNYNYSTPISVSNSNVQVTVGNTGSVILYGNNNSSVYPYNTGTNYYNGNSFYVTNNNNGIANATISGNTLTIYGTAAGSTVVTVCQSGSNQCATVTVTVIAPVYYNYTNYQYIPSQNGQWYYSNQNRCWQHR